MRPAIALMGVVALTAALVRCSADDGHEVGSPRSLPTARMPSVASTAVMPVPDRDESVRFLESMTGSMAGDVGMAITFALDSPNRELRVSAVQPVADRGLRVTYLGYSYCLRGCGADWWQGRGKARLLNALDGTLPLDVPTDGPHSRPSLLLLLEPAGEGLELIRERCLVLHGVNVTLDDGSRLFVTYEDGPLSGLHWRYPPPEGYESCPRPD